MVVLLLEVVDDPLLPFCIGGSPQPSKVVIGTTCALILFCFIWFYDYFCSNPDLLPLELWSSQFPRVLSDVEEAGFSFFEGGTLEDYKKPSRVVMPYGMYCFTVHQLGLKYIARLKCEAVIETMMARGCENKLIAGWLA